MVKLVYFSDVETNKNQLELIDEDQLIRKGLIFYAGDHTDSKQRHHKFPEERVQEIVFNTNKLIEEGESIPVLKDHNKTVGGAAGHIEAPLEVRRITKEDLPNPRLTKLVGKLGVFCEGIVLKGKDVVEKFKSGAVKTVSPGIDVLTNTIRELSLTPTPAIQGLSMYNRANFALTFDELEQEGSDLDAAQEEFEQLSERFWLLIVNITSASEDELSQLQADPETLINQAIEDYVLRIQDLIGLNQQIEEPYNSQQQMQPPMNRGRGQFNSKQNISAFSMADMEEQLANFGLLQSAGNLAARTGAALSRVGRNTSRGFRAGMKASMKNGTGLGARTKGVAVGVARGARGFTRTRTGKALAGTAGAAAVGGAGYGGYKMLNRNKNR